MTDSPRFDRTGSAATGGTQLMSVSTNPVALALHRAHQARRAKWFPVQRAVTRKVAPPEVTDLPPEPEVVLPIEERVEKAIQETLIQKSMGGAPLVQEVKIAVSEYYGVSRREIESERRFTRLIRPRHVAMYLSHILTNQPLTKIGQLLGDRDHTTVLYGARKIERDMASDPMLADDVRHITRLLEARR